MKILTENSVLSYKLKQNANTTNKWNHELLVPVANIEDEKNGEDV